MKNLFFILFIFSCNFNSAQGQKITAQKVSETALVADEFVGFDGFGNCFYIQNNVVYKKVEATILQYQNLSLGKITKVDIVNPLKVIVFYKDFNSVIVLDNQLNEIQRIDFSNLSTPIVATAIGISGQNKLWIFNSLNQQIGLYDLTNANYQNLGVPIKDEFSYYQTDFNYFHWINKDGQWNTCTVFGRVFSNGKTEVGKQIQLLDINKLLYTKDNLVYLKDVKLNTSYEIEIVEKSFKKIYYKDQILSIFTNKGITNYKITLP